MTDKDIFFAGGCFWGTEKYFKLLKGVIRTEVGYANGHIADPTYEQVYTDTTGYAECVHVRFDPDVISLGILVRMFFKAIDPTSVNRQGEDIGTRYRTGVYYTDEEDLPILKRVFEEQTRIHGGIAVELSPLQNFVRAEDYHQNYLEKNPDGYCHLRPELFERKDIRVIAFDADDTLWDNQSFYDRAEEVFIETLSAFGDAKSLSDRLFETESGNMALLGYGAKAVCISMMETALSLSNGSLTADRMARIIAAAKSLLSIPATPLEGVRETLAYLHKAGLWKMVLLTKGDMLDQQNKIARSGLGDFFDRVVIVSSKGEGEYRNLCREEHCEPRQLLMVGNSFKSDIKPAVAVGCKAAYIPFHTMWRHEKVEEFEHPDIVRLGTFAELPVIL